MKHQYTVNTAMAFSLLALLAFFVGWAGIAKAQIAPITTYYVPCYFGTGGSATTIHANNPDRNSTDFQGCQNRNVYSPTTGRIANVLYGKPNTGEYTILIEDDINNACLVVLHMGQPSVSRGMVIPAGHYLGKHLLSRGHVHFTAFDGSCSNYPNGWSSNVALERPVIWREIGYELDSMISLSNRVYFTSQNPSGLPTSQTYWDFRNGPQGWIGVHALGDVRQDPNPLLGIFFPVLNTDPYAFGPRMIPFNTGDFSAVSITMASQTDNCGQFYWLKEGQTQFSNTQMVRFTPNPDGRTYTYTLNLRGNTNWSGRVSRLRIDPACNPVAGRNNAIRIDAITLIR